MTASVEYTVITSCTGPDCGECVYGGCTHWCHVAQSWTPVGGWMGPWCGYCPVCGDTVELTRTGNVSSHLEVRISGFVDGTDQPNYVRGQRCAGSLKKPEVP